MIRTVDLGVMEYCRAWLVQEETAAAIAAGDGGETLFLLEHPPVYTIGSGGDMANVIDPEIAAIRVNRGGDVTFHGPGQLVGYPLVDLGRRGRDLHRYLRYLEELLVGVCGRFGVHAFTLAGQTGVWTDHGKVAAIGVGGKHNPGGPSLDETLDQHPHGRFLRKEALELEVNHGPLTELAGHYLAPALGDLCRGNPQEAFILPGKGGAQVLPAAAAAHRQPGFRAGRGQPMGFREQAFLQGLGVASANTVANLFVVEAEGLSKAFDDRLLFENFDFKLPPGGIVGVILGSLIAMAVERLYFVERAQPSSGNSWWD